MNKTKKILATALVAVVLCSVCLLCTGCPAKKKKYNVEIKIVCREMLNNGSFGPILQEWIFPLDTDKIYVEQEFDGKCYCYFVQGYRYVDYPGLEDRWFAPDDDGDYVFDQDLCLMDPWKENLRYIYARGKYMFMAEVAHPIEWKYRSVRLYITIV